MKGKVTGLKRINKHAVKVYYEGGEFNVFQLSHVEVEKLLYEMKSDGLLFRMADGVLNPNHWCHFVRSHNGVDGSAFITGARFHPVQMGGKRNGFVS